VGSLSNLIRSGGGKKRNSSLRSKQWLALQLSSVKHPVCVNMHQIGWARVTVFLLEYTSLVVEEPSKVHWQVGLISSRKQRCRSFYIYYKR